MGTLYTCPVAELRQRLQACFGTPSLNFERFAAEKSEPESVVFRTAALRLSSKFCLWSAGSSVWESKFNSLTSNFVRL